MKSKYIRNSDWRPDVGERISLIDNPDQPREYHYVLSDAREVGEENTPVVEAADPKFFAGEHPDFSTDLSTIDSEDVLRAHEEDGLPMQVLAVEYVEPYPDPMAGDRWIPTDEKARELIEGFVERGLLEAEGDQVLWKGETPIDPLASATSETRKIEL